MDFARTEAVSRQLLCAINLAQVNGYHYVVDVDIKGFFDHVNHGKLLKQLWSLGIRDKSLLCVDKQNVESTCRGKRKENYSAGGYASRRCSQPIACEHRTQ